MLIRTRAHMLLLAAAILVATGLAGAERLAARTAPQPTSLSQAMPVDPQVTIGQFPNGLRYYVRTNSKPEHRADLRLVVKAGSILEDDDQQGLAHVVEHTAFDGTKHFPKKDIVAFIESLGMRFGADLNAYTSFDETVYTLTVPTDKPETMDRALLVLEDWAHNVSFDPAEIDKERGVVMEEWRLSRGAGARIEDKILPVLLKGSRYADRVAIGKTEIIQNFKPDRLKAFYTDWYRPDLMAVVAVGDFDKAAVERLIKAHFASLPAPPKPRPRPTYDLPDHSGTLYAITTDKEMTRTSVEVDNFLPARPQGPVATYRQEIVDRLFAGMLAARFGELAQKPGAPFIAASVGRGLFVVRTKDEASLRALVPEDGIERGLDALFAEAARVSRFGFTRTELDRQKQNILRSYERLAAEQSNRLSDSRADEYIRNFLTNETLPTTDDEYALHQRLLPQITLEEVNTVASEWFPDRNRLVIVAAPDKAGLVIPDAAKLAAVIKAASTKELTPYVDTVGTATLLGTLPAPGTIARSSAKDAVGITEWELSNGVKVVLKPTAFLEDEILFSATRPGGTSLAPDADYVPASTAAQVITAGGLGQFSAIDLRKVLTGKVAAANPFIRELEEGLSGSSSRRDLETMFQLIYLRFTHPRADASVVSVQSTQMKSLLANQTASPDFAFVDTVQSTLYQNHLRRRPPTPATVDQWDLAKSLAFYKDRFADASGFTFVFVGSFDLPTMKPLVERYLGGLPSTHRPETWRDVGARLATGVIEKKVEKGIEPKSAAAIVFSGPFEYTQTQRVAIRAMADMLQARLLQAIREQLGGTYSITAIQNVQKIPRPEYVVTVQFGCDPQRTDNLVTRVFQEIERFKTAGPTEQETRDEREALLRAFETNSKLNSYLVGQILLKYQYGEDVAGVWDVPTFYKKLDAPMIQQAAKTYLDMNNWVKVTLFPEKK